MNCPACSNLLSTRTVADVTLDVCDQGCGGIWFDQYKFEKFDDSAEPNAEALLNLDIVTVTTSKLKAQLLCPKCSDTVMSRHFFSKDTNVTIDECPTCSGIWLDAGELTEIRHETTNDSDQRKAMEKVFLSTFDAGLRKLREARK